MSRKWLLFLFCLSTLITLAPLSHASLTLKVNESATQVSFAPQALEVALALENSFREPVNQKILIELIDPQGRVKATTGRTQSVARGSQTINFNLPFDVAKLTETDRRQLLWYRLHYRLEPTDQSGAPTLDGLVSLSGISPDLFDLRVAAAEMLHEGMRYQARVQALHPVTGKPAAGVRLDALLTLETDAEGNGAELPAAGVTNAKGYTTLSFDVPRRFPEYPHQLRPAGGLLHVIGQRGPLKVEVENQVLVDQFPRLLVTTDKPIYQPGQSLHLRAIALSPTRRVLAGQDVLFKIDDPENVNVFRETVKSSRFGVASVDWPIPENVRLGDYSIKVSLGSGEDSGIQTSSVRISRYDLPNFSVAVQSNRKYYTPGQDAEVRVSANYLFGQPLARGHVKVVREVEREWNYQEQKWDTKEGDEYEGETDASGVFTAKVTLGEYQAELADNEYRPFRDITFAAYFNDPTTNRTEQRRFDLRITKDPIHVYVIRTGDTYRLTSKLPLEFYVSTFYADGTPAKCQVSINVKREQNSSSTSNPPTARLMTLSTNRYGLAKITKLRVPADPGNLVVEARDTHRNAGHAEEVILFDEDENEVRLETDKSLYRDGEPIVASITSSIPNLNLIVDVGQDWTVLTSQTIRLSGGRASLTIPYRPEFKNRLTIAAYADFPDSRGMLSTRTVLYPRNQELKIEAQSIAQTYRPGDEATINFRVRSPDGSNASALGLTIVDQAVEERFRTDSEFGNSSYGSDIPLNRILGLDEQMSGVSLRDLQRLDMSKPLPAGLDLVAEVLLTQSQTYRPSFFDGDSYETLAQAAFADLIRLQLAQARSVLTRRYVTTGEYPNDQLSLHTLLSDNGVDLFSLRDPWGNQYQPVFSVDRDSDVLLFKSAGADKQFETDDDFLTESNRWPYFRAVGKTVDRAVQGYHRTSGAFIRNYERLCREVSNDGMNLDSLRDRWGQPYRISFEVNNSNYVITFSSSGPDKRFSSGENYSNDDFVIWNSEIDFFVEDRIRINEILNQRLKSTNRFPQNEQQLREALRDSDKTLESLRDPWGHPYYTTFNVQPFYSDRVQFENRGKFGGPLVQQTKTTAVTSTAATISMRSPGADGQTGTQDDFTVGTFAGVFFQQAAKDARPAAVKSPVIFSGDSGAISGLVVDPNGAVIAGVTVTATRTPDSQIYATSSNDEGKYLFAKLLPGTYELRFEARGFMSTIVTSVSVESSNITEVNVELRLGASSETVTVTSSAPVVQTTNATLSEVRFSGRAISQPRSINLVTKSGGSQSFTPRLREYFPETLVWQPSLETDKQGRAQLKFKLADNITTWKMSVIASTEDGQIGTVEKDIKAFQPFFVEHDPPRILTEGDEISLPVVVRNYLDRSQPISLEIKPENWFRLLGPAVKRSQVPAGDAAREIFDFRATAAVKDGKQRLTAIGAEASDAIEKPVTVHPDGEEKSVTASDIVSENATLNLNIPPTAIPNSTHAELKIYPNLLAHVAEGVEAIMKRPYGCGEQTISSTYPSLLLLRHYKRLGSAGTSAGQGSPLLTAKADRYLRAGYNRLLNYRDEGGGFTYWGHGEPDLALTAYALRFLSEARELIAIDDEVINQARAWLIRQQRADGSWAAYDYWDKNENKRRSALLTAYIARVLAMTAEVAKPANQPSQPIIKTLTPPETLALDFLAARVDEIDEPYLIASYALASLDLGDVTRAGKAIAKLRALAHDEHGASFWSLETNTPFYGWGMAGRVETTALVVQALSRFESEPGAAASGLNKNSGDAKLADHGVLFLLREKDSYGVWHSTQATINVLDAMLVLLARDVNAGTSPATEVIVNGRSFQTVAMPASNQLTGPITIDLSPFVQNGENQIQLKRTSVNSPSSVQAVATYYLPWRESIGTQEADWRRNGSGGLRLTTKFNKTESKVSDEITCHVEAERIGFRGYGMMLAEIGLPPGADVDRASLDKAMKGSDWSISQYDILPDRVIVYLWPRAGGTKFDFNFRPRFGLNAQTAASSVYDYYNPEARAIVAPARFVVK